eukprot:966691_1
MTVRETLIFSAILRLPKTLSRSEIETRVDALIKDMMLSDCQHSRIGGSRQRGISGGERKRVSIGVELVTNPGLLFVDEPTSGLDSVTAERIVDLLVALASSGRTVVCSIHQPNSDLWNKFDQVCFMASGMVGFLGSREESVAKFADLGFECPQFTNPADFFLKSLFAESPEEIGKILEISEAQTVSTIARIEDTAAACPEPLVASPFERVGVSTQLRLLCVRSEKNMYRNPITSYIRLIQSVLVALIFGVVFLNVGRAKVDTSDPASVAFAIYDRSACLILCIYAMAAYTTIAAVQSFPLERDLFKREVANNMYSVSSYFW